MSEIEESNRILQEMVARAKAFEQAHPQRKDERFAEYVYRLRQMNLAAEVQLEFECELDRFNASEAD